MMQRHGRSELALFLYLFSIAFAGEWLTAQQAVAKAPERPNIVLIMTDDQGWGDLGVHGNRIIETPHLDSLAGQSARLPHFYVSPVCAPTRACLMTGRYNYRTRAIDTYIGRAMMEPDETTIAEILREAGYATGIFGKWHLGDCYPMRPQDQGFDEVLVHRGGGIGQPSDPPGGEAKYTDPILWHNGEQFEATGYCTDVYFEHAVRWLAGRHRAEQPFFAYIPTNCPHGPWGDAPSELVEKYAAKDLTPVLLGNDKDKDRVACGFAMIENIDTNVGRLLEALDRQGLAENTIVLFMCDNGPYSRRYVGNMRGMKAEVYEGGIRSPFFVRWPARLSPGEKSTRPAMHIDVLPTLLDAAGVPLPDGLATDGRSILPLLEGEDADWPERSLFVQWHRGDVPDLYRHFAVRRGRWKLLQSRWQWEETTPAAMRGADGKQIPPLELYDLQADPREELNVVKKHPEIAASLRREYEAWFQDVSSTRPDNYAPPRIVVGSEHQPVVVLTRQDWRTDDARGWGRQGKWLLRIAGDSPLSLDVLVRVSRGDRSLGDATATLTIGDQVAKTHAKAGDKEVAFHNVRVSPGDADLQVTIQDGDQEIGPYQVVVRRSNHSDGTQM